MTVLKNETGASSLSTQDPTGYVRFAPHCDIPAPIIDADTTQAAAVEIALRPLAPVVVARDDVDRSLTCGKTGGISITISLELLAEIDNYRQKHNYPSRSALIEAACANLVQGVICESCSSVNPKRGKVCSVCGSDLRPTSDDTFLRTLICMSRSDPAKFQEVKDRISPIVGVA